MSEDTRVLQLVEEALIEGRTPEQVCAASPELLPAVRAHWDRCRRLEAQLAGLFPSAGEAPGPDDADAPAGGDGPARTPGGPAGLPPVSGYAVEAVLGRGGVGVVYRARHLKLNRAVALKMLLSGAYAGRVERARFLREARAVAALRHRHVVQVHDVGEHDGRPYFTMELMDGGSLAERLGGAPLPAAGAASLVETIAGAVEAAHRAGIVHRDLKPANVLLASDGTPKVSDFGLALRADDGGGERDADGGLALTLTGVPLGTPSYMAPEQVVGRRGAVGPAADVYALGAILYETLTGRPPFRGESAVETQRQVVADEPVPPSRLSPRVPRDLETVCLKCLAKEPGRRYPSAAALADDLGRFGRGEPVAARRAGRAERAAKWVRRRPAVAALWAGGTLFALALAGGTASWATGRAADARAVADHLDRAAELQASARWAEANAALDLAEMRLGGRRSRELRGRLDGARRDAALVPRLDAIRLDGTALGREAFGRSDRAYAALFREAGLGDVDANPAAEDVAARIRASGARVALVAAVYDWIRYGKRTPRQRWLQAVARRADPDPTGWHERALHPETWRDPAAVAALVSDPALDERPSGLLLFVYGRMLAVDSDDALPFLFRVDKAHPADYWVNMELSYAMEASKRHTDALRYAHTAAVLRPNAHLAHVAVGRALNGAGRTEEAMAAYREALRLDPSSPLAQGNLGEVLAKTGRHADAVLSLQASIDGLAAIDDPLVPATRAVATAMLGESLEALARRGEALVQYRWAIEIDPACTPARVRLRRLLAREGRWDEAMAAWRAHLEVPAAWRTNPADPVPNRAWYGYAECHLFHGRVGDYRAGCELLLEKLGDSTDPQVCDVVGRACLLLPPSDPADLQRATELVDRALAADRARPSGFYAYFRVAKGLAEYRAGRHESAIAIVQGDAAGVLAPLPQLIAAMARARLGQAAASRGILSQAVLAHDWSPGEAANSPHAWMRHVLRREAEALVLPDLPAYLQGRHEPRDNNERLAMTGACQFMELHAVRARLWHDAMAAEPALATQYGRARAVPAAALAGCGLGKEEPALAEAVRDRWRARALEWFGQELDGASDAAVVADPSAAARARSTLAEWRTSREMACVRDAEALNRLPVGERQAWAAMWQRAGEILGSARPKG